MNLTFIGAGFVGLVSAAVFADFKNQVWIIDNDQKKIDDLSLGKIPFYEPGLKELVIKNFKSGKLKFTTDYSQALQEADIIFVCVGTPNKNGEIDLSYLKSSVTSIAKNLKKPAIVVIKSTVPPGINKEMAKLIAGITKVHFEMASVPEFLKEGKAVEDTLKPYRIVIGAEKEVVIRRLLELHKVFPGERLTCDMTSAQLIKYASNCFLSTKISFANSMSILCDLFGGDIKKVCQGMGLDKRIGPDFLNAGIGYGGSCFPKDVKALIKQAAKKKYNFKILKAVEEVNDDQINYFIEKIQKACGGKLKNKVLTVLGLAFKPETSDMRESRAIYLIEALKKKGARIRACDPIAISEAKKIISGVEYFDDPYKALKGSEALLLVTEWNEYQKLDFKKVKKIMKKPVVIDGRNIYNKEALRKLGFFYEGTGR